MPCLSIEKALLPILRAMPMLTGSNIYRLQNGGQGNSGWTASATSAVYLQIFTNTMRPSIQRWV
jgi:hypothetical protein